MKIAACMILVLGSATFAFGETPLKGTVTDVSRGAISDAMVLLHWDPAGYHNVGIKKDPVLKTDSQGGFAAEVPPGFYDLFVSASAFTPACRKVRIKGTASSKVRIVLELDGLVANELGFNVEEPVPPKP
jgi:hypothetical protein